MRQKRYLMPLVEPRGIYCFYSEPLVARLAALIGDRPCVEIAAGDGTLARFLRDAGADVVATDDHSWPQTRRAITDVVEQDAAPRCASAGPRSSCAPGRPRATRSSSAVFKTPSVKTYIMIGPQPRRRRQLGRLPRPGRVRR